MTVIEQLEVLEVRRLGESIGYGHLMALAHELWAIDLESKGISRTGAHVSVSISMVKDEYQKEALNDDKMRKVIAWRPLPETYEESEEEGE